MTPHQRDRLDKIVSEMRDGETRLNPMPGIASVTRKDRWEADTVMSSPETEIMRATLMYGRKALSFNSVQPRRVE